MYALKIILMVLAVIAFPVLTVFLIRLALKIGKGVDHINRTLDDARPQLNMILTSLNQTLEDVNDELEKVGELTDESQQMLLRLENSFQGVENALRSPWARYAGITVAFLTSTLLVRGILRRGARYTRKQGRI
ncbi:MAG: DUF948 domain-containing protein [Actinomycetota bacterium]|nr:DUF948 domain-containing protein [Actinomycetota bacterium]